MMYTTKVENKNLVIQVDCLVGDVLEVKHSQVYEVLCGCALAREFCLDMMKLANDMCAIDTWAEWEAKFKRVMEVIRNVERYSELMKGTKATTMMLVGEDFEVIRQGVIKFGKLDRGACPAHHRAGWHKMFESKRLRFYRCVSCGAVKASKKMR